MPWHLWQQSQECKGIINGLQRGLRKWFKEDWRDVATGKPCGRKSSTKSKRKYPACRSAATAAKMSKGQKVRAVRKKRKAGNPEVNQPQLNGPFHPLDGNSRPNGKSQKHDQ